MEGKAVTDSLITYLRRDFTSPLTTLAFLQQGGLLAFVNGEAFVTMKALIAP